MAITTYAELKTAVTSWLDVATADLSAVIDDLVTVAEKRIFRECRTRDMEDSFSTAISSGTIALPTGYVELKYARIDGTPSQPLERRSAEALYEMYPNRSSEGKPQFIAREASTFIFGPYPDSAYTVKGVYYKRLTVVSSSANAQTQRGKATIAIFTFISSNPTRITPASNKPATIQLFAPSHRFKLETLVVSIH